jgi:predicted ArsR family transcriptional regulator
MDLRHTDVVKNVGTTDAVARAASTTGATAGRGMPAGPHAQTSGTHAQLTGTPAQLGGERGTRARIARLILENGPVTAAGLSTRLGLTPAAVRRHLDGLLAGGMIEVRTARRLASRGRGRPAKLFAITDAGRSAFEHAYDDLATGALRFLAEVAGPGAVAEFARRQVADLERRYQPVMAAADPGAKVQALAEALSADGYAASATRAPGSTVPGSTVPGSTVPGSTVPGSTVPGSTLAGGEQFPQLCEAETEAFGRLLGTPVQRLATIANGDGICTTHVTAESLVHPRTTTISTTTDEPGGISA